MGERERPPRIEIGSAIGVLRVDGGSFSRRRGHSSPAIVVEAQDEGHSAAKREAAPDYSRCLQGPILVVFRSF